MSKYKKTQHASPETIDVAVSIAKRIQKPNQTKEQTKIIAQGIQKGITEYKKQQKVKVRELNRLKKKITHHQQDSTKSENITHEVTQCKTKWLPWGLLVMSWVLMAVFIFRDI